MNLGLLKALILFLLSFIPFNSVEFHDFKFENGIFILDLRICGKVYTWHSSDFKVADNKIKLYDLDMRIAVAMSTCGSTPTQTLRILEILGLGHLSKSAYISRANEYVRPMVKKLYNSVVSFCRDMVFNCLDKLRAMEDEQFSRVHRQRGHAPWCTATVLEEIFGFVLCMVHVEKKKHVGKSLAKVSQILVFILLASIVRLSPFSFFHPVSLLILI